MMLLNRLSRAQLDPSELFQLPTSVAHAASRPPRADIEVDRRTRSFDFDGCLPHLCPYLSRAGSQRQHQSSTKKACERSTRTTTVIPWRTARFTAGELIGDWRL